MMIGKENITGLILTGGRGSRLDGQDKGLISLNGKALIERQVEWIKPQVTRFIISANRNIEHYRRYSANIVQDENNSFDGPLWGILAGLKVCETEWMFVQPVDVPFLPHDTVEKIIENMDEQANGCYLKSDARRHYLSMIIRRKLLGSLELFCSKKQRKVSDFLRESSIEGLELNYPESYFKNLNTISEFEK